MLLTELVSGLMSYYWQVSDWSECSHACGGGTWTREVKCVRSDTKAQVSSATEVAEACNVSLPAKSTLELLHSFCNVKNTNFTQALYFYSTQPLLCKHYS